MSAITMQFDGDGLKRMREALDKLGGPEMEKAARRALNHTGTKARTQVKRTLAAQMGVGPSALAQYGALAYRRSNYARLAHEIYATGKHMPLKAFGARQTRKGVSATPWGKRRLFPKTFIIAAYGGNVYKRTGSGRGPLKRLWGPNIARELVREPTVGAWRAVAATLPARVEHEVRVITAGIVS